MPSEAVGCTQWAPETHPYEQAGSYCLPHTSVITASMLKLIAFTELKQNAPEILGCAGRWGLGYSAHPSLWMLQGATSRKEQPSKPCELARARVDAGPHCLCLSLFPQQSVPASSPLEHGSHKEVSLCKITGFKDIMIYLFIYCTVYPFYLSLIPNIPIYFMSVFWLQTEEGTALRLGLTHISQVASHSFSGYFCFSNHNFIK